MPATTTHLEAEEIVRSLNRGDYDDRLDEIQAALQERRKKQARLRAADLSPGDTVHFSAEVRPRYLVGLAVTVTKINVQSINVNVPDAPEYQRFAGARNMRCPNALIAELAA